MKEIIQRLEAKRIELKLSHEQVARLDEDNLSRSTVWKTLTGITEPSAKTLFALANVLGFEMVMIESNPFLGKVSASNEFIKKVKINSQIKGIPLDVVKNNNYDSNELIPESEETNNIEVK